MNHHPQEPRQCGRGLEHNHLPDEIEFLQHVVARPSYGAVVDAHAEQKLHGWSGSTQALARQLLEEELLSPGRFKAPPAEARENVLEEGGPVVAGVRLAVDRRVELNRRRAHPLAGLPGGAP